MSTSPTPNETPQEINLTLPLEINSTLRMELMESVIQKDPMICPLIGHFGNHMDKIDELAPFVADVMYDLMLNGHDAEWLNNQIHKDVHNLAVDSRIRMEIYKRFYENKTIDLLITNKWLSDLMGLNTDSYHEYTIITYMMTYMIDNIDEFADVFWNNLEDIIYFKSDAAFGLITYFLRTNSTKFQENIDLFVTICVVYNRHALSLVKLLYEHGIDIPCDFAQSLIHWKKIDALEYLHEKHIDILKLTANVEFREDDAKWNTLLEKLGFTLSDFLRINANGNDKF
jgi:hypothetical protein